MYNMEKLLEVLNSKEFIEYAKERYESKEHLMYDEWKNFNVFVRCLKATYVENFLKADTEKKKEYIILSIPMHHIESDYVLSVIETLNTSVSSVNDPRNKKDIAYLKKIQQYEKDPMFDVLSERDEEIEMYAVMLNSFVYLDDLEEGIYTIDTDYRFSDEEIETIKKAVMFPDFNNIMHALYDEDDGINKATSSFDKIEDEALKKLVFHTNKKNPEFEIICEDGTIVNYHLGDIRIKPFKMEDVIKFTKLAFISQYHNGPESEIGGFLVGSVDQNIDPFNMSTEEFEENIGSAFYEVYGRLYGLDEIYSKKMIDNAQDEIKTIQKIIKKYNF